MISSNSSTVFIFDIKLAWTINREASDLGTIADITERTISFSYNSE